MHPTIKILPHSPSSTLTKLTLSYKSLQKDHPFPKTSLIKNNSSFIFCTSKFLFIRISTDLAGTYEVDFQHLKHGRQFVGETCSYILELLEFEPGSPPPTSLRDKAENFVDRLVKLPSSNKLGLGPDDFVWSFWDGLLNIASEVPPCSPQQDVLVYSVLILETIGRSNKPDNKVWKDLPGFTMAVRECWNRSPTTDHGEDDKPADEFTESQWLNLNSFVARLDASHKEGWGPYPVWELRDGLESPLSPGGDLPTPNTRVRVAIEWILRSPLRLFIDSLLHTHSDHSEGPEKSRLYLSGPLYSGANHYSLERWCFWKRRLSEIKTEVGEDLHPGGRLERNMDQSNSRAKKKAKSKARAKARARAKAKGKAEEETETEATASSVSASGELGVNTTEEGDLSNDDSIMNGGNMIKNR
ncbi:uncharacterized protein F4812DRAFT_459608 [Daldinia caldariorum]|uniref:uncharacterized protein n=1 Tax=Daldinia caldariorum TaxID=326644 RepID=UPI00200768A3|nr:uncharacterized protein F4812DRAFT_459608 [Daldinia caldariorum]KAI1467502.1 hypothetical protein F4812DRAFT_459608 [Daldinia caldariorum]